MLKLYFTSIIIWMIINYSTIKMFANKIIENGWCDGAKTPTMSKLTALFVMSAVPILRVLTWCGILYISFTTKDEFDEWQKGQKNN